MEWTDEGIVLGTRRHGEANAILEVMTQDHGRHLGLVRGGGGSRLRPMLQPGNTVRVMWRARLDEHLGHYQVEPLRLHGASQLAASHVVYGVTHLAALCRLLPERDPHPELHERLAEILDAARAARGRGRDGALRTADSGRAWLRSRSGKLRRDRDGKRSGVRIAEVGPRGVADCGDALAGPSVPAAGVSFGGGHAVVDDIAEALR